MSPNPDLLRDRARAYETLGDFDQAMVDRTTLLDQARAGGDQRAECQALLDLGLLWASRDFIRSGEIVEQAVALARNLDDPLLLARALNRLGNWFLNREQPREAVRIHREALTLVEAIDDRRGIAETADLLGLAAGLAGDYRAGAGSLEQAITIFDEIGDRFGLASSLTTLASSGIDRPAVFEIPGITLADARRHAERSGAVCRAIGWLGGEAYAAIVTALCSLAAGEIGRAIEQVTHGIAVAEQIEHPGWQTYGRLVEGIICFQLLTYPAARARFEQVLALAEQIGNRHWLYIASALLAATCIREQDHARARTVLGRVNSEGETVAQRMCQGVRAELALAEGDPDEALRISRQLIRAGAEDSRTVTIPNLWLIRAEALAALGREGEASRLLDEALAAATERGCGHLLWRIHLARGRIWRRQQRSADEFAAARAIVDEIAEATPDVVAIRGVPPSLRVGFRTNALALFPPTRPVTPLQATRRRFDGLTRREREVARLIAAGRSNQAIAEILGIGKRTVQTHIAGIFNKLGCSSRTMIAAWAVERGLVDRQDSG